MAQVSEEQNITVDIQDKLDKAELYLDKNKKNLSIIGGIVLAVVGAFIAYKYWYLPDREAQAQAEFFYAEKFLEKDSIDIAINGGVLVKGSDGMDKTMKGLTEIAEEFSGTKTANMAEYYLGACYMKKGNFEEAIKHYQNFSSDDMMLSAIAVGAIGDANLELDKTDEAIKYYLKASEININNFTSPLYLKKAGLANEAKGNFAEALSIYERIQKEYTRTGEAREIDKYITRVKLKGNL